ncbi:MAG: Gfo/Idh/MocA family oxidoreductase [Verrucomicrobiota bacterium]
MKHRTQVTRRRFLRSAGQTVVCASLAGPWISARPVLGANERIGVGFIGIGRQASGLLGALVTLKEAQFVAVADVNLNRAQEAAQRHGAQSYQDYRRLLERKDVDAIVTATPEHWRGPICIHACQSGKDLYVEKPMSLTIREGRLIVQAVEKYQRVFQTGSQQRSMWANHAGCALVRSGGLGKIERVVAHNYPSPWEGKLPAQKIPEGLDWDMWCGPTEPVPFNQDLYLPRAKPGWLSFRPYSGGEMTGWGSHGLDQVQWALGMDQTGPVEVWTEGAKFDPPTYTEPEASARGDQICSVPTVFFRYANGVVTEVGDGPSGGAIFFGDKGKLTIDRGRCESDPEELAEDALRHKPTSFRDYHLKELAGLHPQPAEANRARRNRSSLGNRLSPGQYCSTPGAQAAMGSRPRNFPG